MWFVIYKIEQLVHGKWRVPGDFFLTGQKVLYELFSSKYLYSLASACITSFFFLKIID